jgi:ATP-dependent DNA ligase
VKKSLAVLNRNIEGLHSVLHSSKSATCVWAFDLLHHNGADLRELSLIERKARLEKLAPI